MNWSSYLIQANLYLVFFYTFYWFILRKETFFNLNRTYLLASALSAALIPLIKLQWLNELFITNPVKQNFVKATVLIMGGYATPIEESWSIGDSLFLLYLFVALTMCFRLVFKLIKVNRLLKRKDQSEAFSFFKKIRVNNKLPHKESIEKHELTHAEQLHSADVLLFEVLSIINWFNPIIYFYRKSIKHIHEFIADEAVLKTEIDKKQYALLLLSQRFGVSANSLTNNFFNQSLLKRRIEMMNKTKSRKTAIIKYGLSAPLFLLAMVLSSAKISESKMINKLSEKVQPEKNLNTILQSESLKSHLISKTTKHGVSFEKKPEKVNGAKSEVIRDTIPTDKVFTNVEILPSFPTRLEGFGKFLSENLKYPDNAKKEKIQGRVFCQFIVEKDGSLSNIKVVRGIGGGCDEEAVRVLALSPKWFPGLQNKKPVRVSYTIPILFQIKEDKVGINLVPPPPPPVEISPDNKALFIIDGKEYKGDKNKLNDELKASDIQSINVLKGETATKKYGDKGKDGVVEITTKKK